MEAGSAAAELLRLVGSPRPSVARASSGGIASTLILLEKQGPMGWVRRGDRTAVPGDVLHVSSSGESLVVLACSRQDGCSLYSLGRNWDAQLRAAWPSKPANSLIGFSRPVACGYDDFAGSCEGPEGSTRTAAAAATVADKEKGTPTAADVASGSSVVAFGHDVVRVVKVAKALVSARAEFRCPSKVAKVALLRQRVLLLGEDGRLFSRAHGKSLELLAERVDLVAACWDNAVFAKASAVQNLDGSFTHDFGEPLLQLACGRCHTLALTAQSRRVFAWGANDHGALGLALTTASKMARMEAPQLVNSRLGPIRHKIERVAEIAAAGHHSALRTEDGSVYAWGSPTRETMALQPERVACEPARHVFAGPDHLVIVPVAPPPDS